jgi:hypothetical protein
MRTLRYLLRGSSATQLTVSVVPLQLWLTHAVHAVKVLACTGTT